MIFLRSDMAVMPEALQYELYHFNETPRVFMYTSLDNRMNLAVVDALVYLYFMKYFVYKKRNQLMNKQLIVNKLESILERQSYLGHCETGYN